MTGQATLANTTTKARGRHCAPIGISPYTPIGISPSHRDACSRCRCSHERPRPPAAALASSRSSRAHSRATRLCSTCSSTEFVASHHGPHTCQLCSTNASPCAAFLASSRGRLPQPSHACPCAGVKISLDWINLAGYAHGTLPPALYGYPSAPEIRPTR